MSEPKSFASLTPTLLARKGGAKPAMRPHGHFNDSLARQAEDDLGWNDHGEDVPPHESAEVVPIVPEVVRQQQAIARRIGTPGRRSALADGRRAAFTLRVDSERHLALRLACTVQGLSAQQLVTEALDRLLGELPDVTALAAQLKSKR